MLKRVSESNSLKEQKHQTALQMQNTQYFSRLKLHDRSMSSSFDQKSEKRLQQMHNSLP